jgi:hypothetical protein
MNLVNKFYRTVGGWKTLAAIVLVSGAFYLSTGTKATAGEQFSLANCQSATNPGEFYACEQAKAARELADTVARIEKKLPDFSK